MSLSASDETITVSDQALAACRRDSAYLEQIVQRKGVLAFDPKTPAGKEVWDMFNAFVEASDPRRDASIRLQGVELAVEAILIRRAMMTQIINIGRFSTAPTQKGISRRSAMSAAIAAWNTAASQFEKACKMMGIKGYADLGPIIDNPDDLKSVLAKKAEEIKDAEFREVAGGPSTPGAAAAPPPPDASAAPEGDCAASSAGGDAPFATPGPPTPP